MPAGPIPKLISCDQEADGEEAKDDEEADDETQQDYDDLDDET